MTIAAMFFMLPLNRVLVTPLLAWMALVGGPAAAQNLNAQRLVLPDGDTWNWAQPVSAVRALEINLLRANVVIEPSNAPIAELIISVDSDQDYRSAVSIVVSEHNGQYRISDRYPPRSAMSQQAECLPPIDERGDFWHYNVLLNAKLRVPRRMIVSVRTMAGGVVDRR
jgi:hypothetical protein